MVARIDGNNQPDVNLIVLSELDKNNQPLLNQGRDTIFSFKKKAENSYQQPRQCRGLDLKGADCFYQN